MTRSRAAYPAIISNAFARGCPCLRGCLSEVLHEGRRVVSSRLYLKIESTSNYILLLYVKRVASAAILENCVSRRNLSTEKISNFDLGTDKPRPRSSAPFRRAHERAWKVCDIQEIAGSYISSADDSVVPRKLFVSMRAFMVVAETTTPSPRRNPAPFSTRSLPVPNKRYTVLRSPVPLDFRIANFL